MPQPIGIAQYEGSVIVVCEDGAVYRCDHGFQGTPEEAQWIALPPVPNTEIQDRMQRLAKQEDGGLQWISSAGSSRSARSDRGPAGNPRT